MRHICSLLLVAALIITFVPSGRAEYKISADSLYRHISVLADDSLEGRETGEPGEWKAADYIITVFQALGLEPKGDDGGYRQAFEFTKAIVRSKKNRLAVNGSELEIDEEFLPLKQSASKSFSFDEVVPVGYGITDDDGFHDDYEGLEVAGKAVLVSRFAPPEGEGNPHVDYEKHSSIIDKVRNALEHEASGVFMYTPEDHDDTLMGMGGATHVSARDVPVVFLRRRAFEKLGLSLTDPAVFSAEGETDLVRVRDTGFNVVGYLPGQTDTTIVIGAHYDHLGYGGPGSGSRYLGTERLIHNGADDNGSGTAAMLELARYYASHGDQNHHSMLFMGFSGEEKGLLGSGHWVKNPTIDKEKIMMMVNMDMIGRLRGEDKGLAIFGTGTSAEFEAYFDTLSHEDIKLTGKESGTGPSDHTSFYNQGIPVLGFFTGAHEDYHKPEDDIDGIDYDGILLVTDIVTSTVDYFDSSTSALTFQKTKAPDAGKRASSFSVTLGIMPDYIAEVKGLRVDGVSPERPGERAGLLTGDVIVKMGEYDIEDIYGYMNALGKFRKGDTCIVVVEREGAKKDLTVIFE